MKIHFHRFSESEFVKVGLLKVYPLINKIILNNLNKTPHARQTYIFSSNADKVSPYNRLLTLNNSKVSMYEVKDLNHIEMVSLISTQQRNVLLSLLDG